jgi:hypothetical protein
LTANERTDLVGMSFGNFVSSVGGKEASRGMVIGLIDKMGLQYNVCLYLEVKYVVPEFSFYKVDSISEILRSKCPAFCVAEDVILYKVGVDNYYILFTYMLCSYRHLNISDEPKWSPELKGGLLFKSR